MPSDDDGVVSMQFVITLTKDLPNGPSAEIKNTEKITGRMGSFEVTVFLPRGATYGDCAVALLKGWKKHLEAYEDLMYVNRLRCRSQPNLKQSATDLRC